MKKLILSIIFLTIIFSECSKKYPLDLGGNYKIDYDGNSYFYIIDINNTVIIGSHITKFNFDSIFIIVEQKPVNLIFRDTFNNSDMNLKKRDKLFQESMLRYYWIINKKEKSEYSLDTLTNLARYSNVYGPFKKHEYLQKREELKIPKVLVLKEK